MNKLFSDLVIVELASVLAGPSVGMFFAELGATVIKVENPRTNGDITRSWHTKDENSQSDISAYFSCVNWGKYSIGLDFNNSDEFRLLKKLIEKADVVIVSFKPGDAKKLNLDYESFSKINEKIIYAEINGFGENDERPAFDAILQAATGFMSINGTDQTGPLKMPVALIDVLAGHHLKEAILISLINRMKTGIGANVKTSLFNSGIVSLVNQAANFLFTNKIPKRTGSEHPNIVPYGSIFTTSDNVEIVFAVGTDNQFAKLCELLDLNYLKDDKKFSTNKMRVKNRRELLLILSKKLSGMNSEILLPKLEEHKIPASKINNIEEAISSYVSKNLLNNHSGLRGIKSIAFESDSIKLDKDILPPPHFNEHRDFIIKNFID